MLRNHVVQVYSGNLFTAKNEEREILPPAEHAAGSDAVANMEERLILNLQV